MKPMILFFSLLLILSCIACNRSPQPVPQASTATLALTLSPLGNKGNGPLGNGTVRLTPNPQSGNVNCQLVGNQPITCVEQFVRGATVILRVSPEDSTLESINGCNVTKCEGCPLGVTTCQVTMDGDKGVSAVFIGLIK